MWWFNKFGTNALFVEAEDCGSDGIDSSPPATSDDSDELTTAAVRFLEPLA